MIKNNVSNDISGEIKDDELVEFTSAKKTWCPGCTNFAIMAATKKALSELITDGNIEKKDVVVGSGIGCHAKIADYLDFNSFCTLHGRVLPIVSGMKVANPALKILAFSGDGDAYAEGMEHFIHSAKRNINLTYVVHDNKVFALTTGQSTPTSLKGYKGKSTPFGNPEEPLNPLLLALSSGATFIARSYAMEIEKTKELIKKGMMHQGFSLINIIQPCITFYDNRKEIAEKMYWLDEKYDQGDFDSAYTKIRENGNKIPMGIFYQVQKNIF